MRFSAVMNSSRDSESITVTTNAYVKETAPPAGNYAVFTVLKPLIINKSCASSEDMRSLSHTIN